MIGTMDEVRTMDFEITTQYTLEEYKQFNRTLLSKASKLRPVLIVGVLIIAAEDLFCLVWGGLNLFFTVLPITALCVAALFLIHWLGGRSAVKIWESKYLTKDAALTFHFTADRMEVIFGDSKEIYPYEISRGWWRQIHTFIRCFLPAWVLSCERMPAHRNSRSL